MHSWRPRYQLPSPGQNWIGRVGQISTGADTHEGTALQHGPTTGASGAVGRLNAESPTELMLSNHKAGPNSRYGIDSARAAANDASARYVGLISGSSGFSVGPATLA